MDGRQVGRLGVVSGPGEWWWLDSGRAQWRAQKGWRGQLGAQRVRMVGMGGSGRLGVGKHALWGRSLQLGEELRVPGAAQGP